MAVLLCSLQNFPEEGSGTDEDELVDFHLLTILTNRGDISEVFVPPQLSKGTGDIVPEVIPLQTELFHN